MARKDDIFKSFLEHEILKKEYNLTDEDLNITLRQALNSDIPIIKAIALIVDSSEKINRDSDQVISREITQYLNTATL